MTKLKIGKLSSHTGCPIETIRYYELEGLLPPAACSQGNYRLYGQTHVERLQFIRHCRTLDMTLDEVRSLLQFRDMPEENCAQINTLLDHHIDHVAGRIAELKALQSQLKRLCKQCHSLQAAKDCGILQRLTNMEDEAPDNLGSHGGSFH